MVSPWQRDRDAQSFLITMIKKHQRYQWGRFHRILVYRWLLQVLEGLKHLHSQGISHGDLHSRNLLVVNPKPDDPKNIEFDVVFTDFGLAVIQEANSREQYSLRAGYFRAPEQLDPARYAAQSDTGRPTEKSDIIAFAALCYELYTTKSPFSNLATTPRNNAISALKPLERTVIVELQENAIPVTVPDPLWEIIESCWTVPDKRPTLDWIEGKLENMQRSLTRPLQT